MEKDRLTQPYGGSLIDLIPPINRVEELKFECTNLESWNLTASQICDLEMLLNGGFSPLTGFMERDDYESVCSKMRLSNEVVWPIPITLDVTTEFAEKVSHGQRIVLRHPEGIPLAIMTIQDSWKGDNRFEAEQVLASNDLDHPAVSKLLNYTNPVRIGGPVEGIELPSHYSFTELRHTPSELRANFEMLGVGSVVAFQTRNPMHRAHVELTKRAAQMTGAHLLIHPVVGMTKPGDIDYFVRVRCYKAALSKYPLGSASLSLLPIAMRMAGPREAVWHAIVRKNYGCSHFIVGRDHAGPGVDGTGKPYYGPYEAQELIGEYSKEIGVEPVIFEEMVYVEDTRSYLPRSEVPEKSLVLSLSGTDLRKRLAEGSKIPEWFSYPEMIQELRKAHPEKNRQGFVVFLTGLPSSGKSTIAAAFTEILLAEVGRPVTILDGDLVRKNLSSELTFSKEHRDLNIRRIGFVASEIARHRGIAVCAPIAPYEATRRQVREMTSAESGFIEVHVDTPVEECEKRDRKGLYAQARIGKIKNFTGVDDPYEVPKKPEIRIETLKHSPTEAAQIIMDYLRSQGYI